MSLLKSKQIVNCCQPNALLTLQEYLQDYAGEETKAEGENVIKEQLSIISNEKVKEKTIEYLQKIKEGQRDFRF